MQNAQLFFPGFSPFLRRLSSVLGSVTSQARSQEGGPTLASSACGVSRRATAVEMKENGEEKIGSGGEEHPLFNGWAQLTSLSLVVLHVGKGLSAQC